MPTPRRRLGDELQPPKKIDPKPQLNIAAIAEQIGHLTITAAMFEHAGEPIKSEAAHRAAAAYLNLALVTLDLEPTKP